MTTELNHLKPEYAEFLPKHKKQPEYEKMTVTATAATSTSTSTSTSTTMKV